jgi:hypothetical protein
MPMKILAAGLLLLFATAACTVTPSLSPVEPATDAARVEPVPAEQSDWGALLVSVTDEDGTPQANVPLELTGLDEGNEAPDWESAPMTGPDGTIELTNLLGAFEVATILDGAVNDVDAVVVEPGETARVDLVVS